MTVDFQHVQGQLVTTRFTTTGMHEGVFEKLQPMGRHVTHGGIDIGRIVDGRIVEAWVNDDALGLLLQLDAVRMRDGSKPATPTS